MNDARRLRQWIDRAAPATRAVPDPAWRARVRAEFVRPQPKARRGVWTRPRVLVASVGLAAATWVAVALLAPAPAWELVERDGPGGIRVGAATLPPGAPAGANASLRHGGVVEVPDGSRLALALPGIAFVELPGGTRVRLPRLARPGARGEIVFALERGEIRIATGPRFPGRILVVSTTGATARVTGTTFAVLRGPDSTCVCVFEGRVRVEAAGRVAWVPAGRRVVHSDGGGRPTREPIRPGEAMKLDMLRTAAGWRFAPGGR